MRFVVDYSVYKCRKPEKKEPKKRIKEKDKKEIYHLYLILSHPIRLPTAGFIVCPTKVRVKSRSKYEPRRKE